MTVKQLVAKLAVLPDSAEVLVDVEQEAKPGTTSIQHEYENMDLLSCDGDDNGRRWALARGRVVRLASLPHASHAGSRRATGALPRRRAHRAGVRQRWRRAVSARRAPVGVRAHDGGPTGQLAALLVPVSAHRAVGLGVGGGVASVNVPSALAQGAGHALRDLQDHQLWPRRPDSY